MDWVELTGVRQGETMVDFHIHIILSYENVFNQLGGSGRLTAGSTAPTVTENSNVSWSTYYIPTGGGGWCR
jgi:hypothetical protein